MNSINQKTQQIIIERIHQNRSQREQFLSQMQERQKIGLKIAQQCAALLKEKFKVKRVVLFGSLLAVEQMTWHSDIDLAVWGLPPESYLKAIATLLEIETDFMIDLVEAEKVPTHILDSIKIGREL